MWVYIESERFKDDNGQIHLLWTVGFYDPSGNFCGDSDHNDREKAAARVHYLNGGKSKEEVKTILSEIEYDKAIEREMDDALAYEARGIFNE